ncbi:hypothetical protein LVD15_25570 [Fulvivirga maritima]|uniref:hypothetical protein n=1 Tax=Fulvivirga maritima TaxID=2904247 RepID=UPI001F15EA82|nr:hypothetical protein [Fulvivirga maritima]UII26624.1 hypothetical protein LVD15_25570 [Fulvivirga maritima]
MDKQNRSNFEDQWQQAFEDAELDVSNHVWERIELDLANANNSKMKRRLLFFQLLAAASVVFALTISGIYSYQWYSNKNAGLSVEESGIAMTDAEQTNGLGTENDKSNGSISDSEMTNSDPDNLKSNHTSSSINETEEAAATGSEMANQSHGVKENSNKNKALEESKEGISDVNLLADNERNSSADMASESELAEVISDNLDSYTNNTRVAENSNSNEITDGIGNNAAQYSYKEKGSKSHSLAENRGEGIASQNNALSGTTTNSSVAMNDNNETNNQYRDEVNNASSPSQIEVLAAQDNVLLADLDKRFEYLKADSLMDREMQMVPWYAYVPTQKEEASSNDTWAGVGFSAGRFDPNIGGGTNSTLANMDFEGSSLAMRRNPTFSEETVGQSVNVGVSVGTQLAKRWVVQGGLSYLQQQASSASNVVSNNTTTTGRTASKTVTSFNSIGNNGATNDEVSIEFTRPYEIVNTYQLVSVPLQAGYIVLDKKFNITILSGVANNILIRNTFDGSDGDVEDLTVSAGSESPYRTYQVSGLLGSEFSYEMGGHYILSFLPQLRQALTSVTKSDSDFDSRPTILEVGFRFKYIF